MNSKELSDKLLSFLLLIFVIMLLLTCSITVTVTSEGNRERSTDLNITMEKPVRKDTIL